MYELTRAIGGSYYFDCPSKIGLIKLGEDRVCLIDSGNDKDAAKKIKKQLDSEGWGIETIYNTHSHADHIGGNQYLQKQTSCRIFAPDIELCFTRNPILEPISLYSSNPPKDLRHKFLLAAPSSAEMITEEVMPENISIIPLPGHSFNMLGFRTDDGAVYLADALASRETLDKYALSFLYDAGAYLETLRMIENMDGNIFIPSHAPACENIAPLARYNADKVLEAADKILVICKTPCIFEELLQKLFFEYGLSLNFSQYALVGSTVRSYITWLKETGRIECIFEDNLMKWQTI